MISPTGSPRGTPQSSYRHVVLSARGSCPLLSSGPPRAAVVDTWSHESNLDFLRTIAVVCVVVRHVLNMFDVRPIWWLNLQALGIFGVLLFFVHTSLVLMISLDRWQRVGHVSSYRLWAAFLIRRFFRIYPLSVTAVLITYFILAPLADASAARAGIASGCGAKDLWANLFLVQDLALRPSILAPLWSLPAEVQMYIILPVLFFLVKRIGVRAIVWVVWPVAVAVALLTWKLDLRFTVARYAPCFVAGVGCFGLLRSHRPLGFRYLPLLVSILLLAYMTAYTRFGLQAGLGILVTLAVGALIPLFATMQIGWLRRLSSTVAKYSFGVYLFHVPCIWIAFGKLRSLGTVCSSVCFVAMVAAASVLFYHLVEDVFIRIGKGIANRVSPRMATVSASQIRSAASP